MERRNSFICVIVVLLGIVVYNWIQLDAGLVPRKEGLKTPEWLKSCEGRLLENQGGIAGYLFRAKRFVQDIGNSIVSTIGWAIGYDFKIVFGCPAEDQMIGSVSKLVNKIGFDKLEAMVMQSMKNQPDRIRKSDGVMHH